MRIASSLERSARGAGVAPALLAEGITKRWRADDDPLLAGLDLRVDAGRVIAIAGPNGAGKTTLLRIVGGLITPDSGAVRAYGVDLFRQRAEYQRRVGFVGAGNSGLYGRLRVEDHLELAARLALMSRRDRRPAIRAATQTFGLEALGGRRVDRLSMGQRQRLRLALGFLHRPSLILLDEPTTSLDETGIGTLQAALDQLVQRGGAAVICLPTGWEASLSADRLYVLRQGRLEPR